MELERTGIVYVATKKDRYAAEAFLSATSAKRLIPTIPITLFTNLNNSVFSRAPCFDTVIPVNSTEAFGRTWSEGQLDRIRCLPYSPYEYTLHLDSDTRVRSQKVREIFSLLNQKDIAMVECSSDNSFSCEYYGKRMFNVGFILYRKLDNVLRLFREWEAVTESFFQLARDEREPSIQILEHIESPELRRKLLFMDQLSMVQLLSPEINRYGIDYEILDGSWNYRGSKSGRPPPDEIKIDHHPDLRKRYFVRDLAAEALRTRRNGNTAFAIEILNWIDSKVPGLRDVMRLLIICQLEMKNNKEAIILLNRLLNYFPEDPWAKSGIAAIERL